MTVLQKIQSMTSAELADFLDTYFYTDENPPVKYFNNKFCYNCEPLTDASSDFYEAPCEHTNHCVMCGEYEVLHGSNMTRLWLDSDEENLLG